MKRSRGLIIGSTIILLALSVSVTFGHVFAVTQPDAVAQLIPCNAVAKATAARAKMISSQAIDAERRQASAHALASLRCSPLIARALVVLGLDKLRDGDSHGSAPYLRQAERLSRRDLDAQMLLLEQSVTDGNIGETLRHYDTALRVNRRTEIALFPTLANAMADPDLQPDILALLRTSPPWTDRFLYAAAGQTAALPQLPGIFEKLGKDFPIGEALNRHVMRRLISEGYFDSAQRLVRQVTGRPSARSTLITNGDFSSEGDWPPVDWQLLSNGGVGATIDVAEKSLQAFSNGEKGIAAQQILSLPPGRFTIRTEAEATSDINSYASWNISCADKSGRTLAVLTIPAIGEQVVVLASFRVPEECRYQWVRLAFINAEPQYRNVVVKSVAIDPA